MLCEGFEGDPDGVDNVNEHVDGEELAAQGDEDRDDEKESTQMLRAEKACQRCVNAGVLTLVPAKAIELSSPFLCCSRQGNSIHGCGQE